VLERLLRKRLPNYRTERGPQASRKNGPWQEPRIPARRSRRRKRAKKKKKPSTKYANKATLNNLPTTSQKAAATNRTAAGWPGGENRWKRGRRPNKRRSTNTNDRESRDQRVGNSCNVCGRGSTDLESCCFRNCPPKPASARMEQR